MTVSDPTFTRQPDGTVTVEWPDPPRRSYEVTHELLIEWMETFNALVRARAALDLLAEAYRDDCVCWGECEHDRAWAAYRAEKASR